jgi:hypothetical protein
VPHAQPPLRKLPALWHALIYRWAAKPDRCICSDKQKIETRHKAYKPADSGVVVGNGARRCNLHQSYKCLLQIPTFVASELARAGSQSGPKSLTAIHQTDRVDLSYTADIGVTPLEICQSPYRHREQARSHNGLSTLARTGRLSGRHRRQASSHKCSEYSREIRSAIRATNPRSSPLNRPSVSSPASF